ncbi:acyltransferase 3 [Phialemonium atrogriseum]|uniref:Acyltransferase 3 n=1 Tax=Phialemonium atrogriseum TaxID=1093897 RepID=A0AAJ0FLV9_9PEZI|nr:acyltransferase 3 [Phialemonium atrogriseum]KAK1767114.1 acyltransferase 3 [Phialemonium atrogriseum]
MLRGLLPSFVAEGVWPEHRTSWKVHPTSYLDGLRGIASILVFFCHYTEENHQYLLPPHGLNPDFKPSSVIQLPFLRIIFSGRPMVHIFFVISGFVLSYKPIRSIHARNFDACFSALSSSAFRRPFRLFGPCVVSTFIIALLIQSGWLYTPMPSMSAQFWAWVDALFHSVMWPWGWDFDLRPGYDVHLWTIPIEFAHSMLLFLVILVLSRVRQLIRQSAVFCLMVYFLACGKWAAFEFIGGMFLAEIHLSQATGPKKWEFSDVSTTYPQRRSFAGLVRAGLHVSILISALLIGGWPNFDADKTPGIRYLLANTPNPFATMDDLAPQKFWFAVAAIFTVWSCGELSPVRRFLEGRFPQYCGRISYAVYIVHGPVLAMFQDYVVGITYTPATADPSYPDFRPALPTAGIKGLVGVDGPTQQTISWLAGLLILGPLVIWAADIFWRLVDVPIVALAKGFESACLENNEQSTRDQDYYSLAG